MIDLAISSQIVPGLRPLIEPEIDGTNQFTHYIEIKSSDFPGGLAIAAPFVGTFATFPKYCRLNNVALIVQQGFEDTTDPANNSVLIDVGEIGALTGWIAAAQCAAKSGSLIKVAWKTGATAVPKDYAADTNQVFTVTPMAGKTLSNLRKGSVIVLYNLFKFPFPVDKGSSA
jgi:hypothetical protein